MSFITQTRRSKFKTEEERAKARIESIKKACYKYQLKTDYKDYRQQKYKEHIYNIIKGYMITHDKSNYIDNLIDDEDTSREMRAKFKKLYGEKVYKKYLYGK